MLVRAFLGRGSPANPAAAAAAAEQLRRHELGAAGGGALSGPARSAPVAAVGNPEDQPRGSEDRRVAAKDTNE